MIRSNAIANYVGTAWAILMGVAFLPLYIRYLGAEAYGLIGIFAVMQTWLALLDAGITPAMTRETSRFAAGVSSDREIWNVLRTTEILGAAAAAISFVILCFLAYFVADNWIHAESIASSTITQAFLLMGIVVGLKFIENIYRGCLIGLQRQVSLNLVTSIFMTIRSGGAVVILAFVSNSIIGFFVWQALVSALLTATLALMSYRALPRDRHKARFNRGTLARIWRFSFGTLLITVLGTLLSQSDKLVLSNLLSLKDFGYYSFAAVIAGYIRVLGQPIDQAIYPSLIKLMEADKSEELADLYHKAAQFSSVLMGSAAVWLAVYCDAILTIWTGDPVLSQKIHTVTIILLAGSLLNGLLHGPYYLQMAAGWTSLLAKTNMVMAVLLCPAIWFATERFGMIGGASAWLAINAVYVVIIIQLMHRRLLPREKMAWYTQDTALPILAALAGAIASRALIPTDAELLVSLLSILIGGVVSLAFAAAAAPHVRSIAIHGLRRYKHA